jgi:hypothetical protein
MTRLLAIALAACLCSGCFIFEELDKGQKYMDDHAGIRERIQIALSRVPDALASLKEILSWRGDEDGNGSSRGERDPRDAMVRCAVDGGMLFTSRIECEGRGGEVLGEAGLRSDDV